MKAGSTIALDIVVKNTGSEPWFTHAAVAWVEASYRWLNSKGEVLAIEGERTSVDPHVVQPGESRQVTLKVVAPPNPGSYTLWVSMVQEGVAWFYGKGAKPLALPATVD